ncbi:NTP pyrophosphatase, house-cleaning of non-canonical NTPs [Aquiflexum balticum DSM 16537]|uniref:NTP pyrophosphatase, house-cleaning of non-canonical NTPs n=1 Tax=Aquiflexum balticum DSM 16537 TaxID=758820 RepID=A0A1W2H877_9BACT|nr:nucleotide pyrophosphohydrolase [Aquiflexum balticum]SMD44852.1 NTP pyrophosphatase, house-cleaning of non-canonical NTPs [Aquiflexum balticum DSM 16537]
MEKLKDVIRKPDFKPEDYEGFMASEFQFMRVFFLENKDLKTSFDEVNSFLAANGFHELNFEDFIEELSIRSEGVGLYADQYANETNKNLILTIDKYDPVCNPIDQMIVELVRFRNERDWAQFHNPKDLALALSVEASELLELFLWKSAEEVNEEKVKEELADVFAFGLLLAEKYGFNVREIVLEKIAKTA